MAQTTRSRYCGSTCRAAASKARPPVPHPVAQRCVPVAHPDGSDTGAVGPIEAEVLAHPAIVAGQGGVNGQVAVSLARRIDQQADPGSGMASLSRALAVEIATLDDRPANWQPSAVDELISRRSRRDEQLARRYSRDA